MDLLIYAVVGLLAGWLLAWLIFGRRCIRGLPAKETEGVAAIKALNAELERLHDLMGQGDKEFNTKLLTHIMGIEEVLVQIAKRHNGLEY